MSSAPYQLDVSGSDDETFQFSVPFENADGSAFPFAEYLIEYVVTQDGSPVLTLTQGNGITIQDDTVAFKATRGTLGQGEYEHGCRIRNIVTGDETQVFAGSVVIGEGQFSSAPVSPSVPPDTPGSGASTLAEYIQTVSDPLYLGKDVVGSTVTPTAPSGSTNHVKPTYMRFSKASGVALVEGTDATPDATTRDPVLFVQKFTKFDNGTDMFAHDVGGVFAEVVQKGTGLTGTASSSDTDATWIAMLGNSVQQGVNQGTAASPDFDARGNVIGVAGFARADGYPGGIICGVWGYSATPSLDDTTFDALPDSGMATVGAEINLDIRHKDPGAKSIFVGKGVSAGLLLHNYASSDSSGTANQNLRDWNFGIVFNGSNVPSAGGTGGTDPDVNHWAGFHTGILLDKIKSVGIRMGTYWKAGSYGIRFPDAYSGSNEPAAAIHLGNSKIQMGQYTGSSWNDNDLWHNGGSLYFRYGSVNQKILTDQNVTSLTMAPAAGVQPGITQKGIGTDPFLTMQRAGNTSGAASAVTSGTRLGGIYIGGHDGTAYANNATIETSAAENWTTSAHGQGWIFTVTPKGSTTRGTSFSLDSEKNVVVGTAALATTATNGFLYVPTVAGTPTGTPTSYTGRAPILVDSTGSKLWVYVGGAWKSAALA